MASFKIFNPYVQHELVSTDAVKGTATYTNGVMITAAEKAYEARFAQTPDVSVVLVGDLVKYTPATATIPGFIERVTSLAAATHIVAQSDQTLEYGHIPVENRDYKYVPVVLNTFIGTATAAAKTKKLALFAILDKSNIILNTAPGYNETV